MKPPPPSALLAIALDRDAAAQIRKGCELFMDWARTNHLPVTPAVRALEAQCAAIARNGTPNPPDVPATGHGGSSQQRLTFGVDEVADMLGVSSRTVQTHVSTGDLPSRKIGGRRLVTLSDLEAFINDGTDT